MGARRAAPSLPALPCFSGPRSGRGASRSSTVGARADRVERRRRRGAGAPTGPVVGSRPMSSIPKELRFTADHKWVRESNDPQVVDVAITYYAHGDMRHVVFME